MWVVTIAIIGFIGAWKRNRYMLLTLKCCGGVNASDWKTVPASCCASGKEGCKDPYPVGCAQATYDLVKGYFLTSGIITTLLCIVELTAVICACILAHQYKNYDKV
uniref:Tetraspanin n=1 Tax=Mesocestoides corti TaxID=53468 RepID=A0A5K3FXB9_MESCO